MSLDDILDMSFEQISICSSAVFKQKINMLEMVFEPISTMLGGKSKNKAKQKSNKSANLTPEEKAKYDRGRDAKLHFELMKAGIRVSPE
jgi:hypothetical protein